jgi:hypothetical protein
MRWFSIVLSLSLTLPARAVSQQEAPKAQTDAAGSEGSSFIGTVAHYGKWMAGIGAVALTYLGAREHERSDDAWNDLLAICSQNQADCSLGPNGRYINPAAEQLYSVSLRYDDRARMALVAGQAALLLAVGLFILDMRHDDDGPENIPLEPLAISSNLRTGDTRVGLHFNF